MTLKIHGVVLGEKQLERAFEQLPKATGKSVLRRALKQAAKPTVQAAKDNAPIDDGDLRDSIRSDTRLSPSQKKRRSKSGTVELFVGPSWPKGAHGIFPEWGTVNMPAEPYLRPAWEATRKKVLNTLESEIWKSLAKAAKSLAKRAEKGTLSKSARKALAQRK